MKRILALLLALLAVLCSCSGEQPPVDNTTETTFAATDAPAPVKFMLDARYKILRSEDNDYAVEAAQYIQAAVNAVSGERLTFGTDWVRKGDPVVPSEFEILVGVTNRPESEALFASMKRGDWEYRVSENQILICGGGSDSTLEAAKAFCSDLLGYTGDKPEAQSAIELTSGVARSFSATYPITSVTLNGKPITEYVLAVPNMTTPYRTAAATFNDLLSERSGFQLAVKTSDALTDGELYIELGQKKNELGAYEYTISSSGGVLTFSGGADVLADAVTMYLSTQISQGSGEMTLGLPTEALYGIGGEQNGLVLKNETKKAVADGVEYRVLSYAGRNGEPVNAYVLVVEPGKAQVINGTPNGGTATHNVRATTIEAANAAKKQGYRVLAGVNADFFRINSDYSPQGICVKNGQILNSNTSYPYFGVTKDNKFIIGEASTFKANSADLLEAVGGRHIILKDGKVHQVAYGQEFGYTRHPRTSVGYDKDGRLYLLVVDGRQPSVSNGASLTDLAIIMLQLGATDALNLDGGGSSTFILENGNGFKAMNSPSDGSLRKVYNSLLVVTKE